jgi:hypothetical protein
MARIGILIRIKAASVFSAVAVTSRIVLTQTGLRARNILPRIRARPPHVADPNSATHIRETNKKGRKRSSSLPAQPLNHVLKASMKLRKRHDGLSEYKKAGLERAGLHRRVFGETCQTLKKWERRYDRDARIHETKKPQYRAFLEKGKKEGNLKKNCLTFIIDATSPEIRRGGLLLVGRGRPSYGGGYSQ